MTIDNERIDNLLKDYKRPKTSSERTAAEATNEAVEAWFDSMKRSVNKWSQLLQKGGSASRFYAMKNSNE